MRLGLLGGDAQTEAVAAAAVAGGHVVLPRCPGSEDGPGFATLLDPGGCDAVLVASASWDDRRADDERTLVQAGRPLLVAQPPGLSMVWLWELEMIRRDTGGPLIPLLPARLHPFVARLRTEVEAALAAGASDGSLVIKRRLADRRKWPVLSAFARDVDLVRAVAGDPSRLAVLGLAGDDEAAWSAVTVGLTGPTSLPVRWEVAAGVPGLTITLHHGEDDTVVEIPDAPGLSWAGSDGDGPWPGVAFDGAAAMVAVLERALAAGPEAEGRAATLPPATWADAARAVEIAETVPRSLARGRALDLHREEFSELGTFRGTMASLGCGLIMVAFVIAVVGVSLGGLARELGWEDGGRIAASWPLVLLGALGAFLALQVLPWLVADSRHE